MGSWAPQHSFVTKAIVRRFVSMKTIIKNLQKYWSRHYSSGILEEYYDRKKKRIVVRLKDFMLPPIACTYFEGYCLGALTSFKKFKDITVKETRCANRGDEYHEFLIK